MATDWKPSHKPREYESINDNSVGLLNDQLVNPVQACAWPSRPGLPVQREKKRKEKWTHFFQPTQDGYEGWANQRARRERFAGLNIFAETAYKWVHFTVTHFAQEEEECRRKVSSFFLSLHPCTSKPCQRLNWVWCSNLNSELTLFPAKVGNPQGLPRFMLRDCATSLGPGLHGGQDSNICNYVYSGSITPDRIDSQSNMSSPQWPQAVV